MPDAAPAVGRETVRLVREQLTEALTRYRAAGADSDLSTVLRRLGHVEQDAGRARRRHPAIRGRDRRRPPNRRPAVAVRHLGDAHRAARRLAEAEACYDEALALYAAVSVAPGVAECEESLTRLG